MKDKNIPKESFIILALTLVSVLLSVLQVPVMKYLSYGSMATMAATYGNTTYTLPFYIILVANIVFIVCVFLKNTKVTSKLFSSYWGLRIVTLVYGSIGLFKAISAYKNYPIEMSDIVSSAITQCAISICINIVYLALYVFLLIDNIADNKHLKVSKIIVAIVVAISLISAISNFANNHILYALVQSGGVFSGIALVIYYFKVAKSKNIKVIENKLIELKAAFENGAITEEDYKREKAIILKTL